ncbi:TM0106 family RecB-like putative nuclease [Tolypothrix sp. FACHB-123]|uniref:TM0106 family RecB-like putative nuclease n=1 Tax=Tolypothrix sp. FACHB-123 TaxID=2692868 RepID=UPI00168657B3|nr:TM0106 family RecB-like putative nuclease [Tolypothrix sp. FACHB-123]MBD2358739.1 TM0106 family RecB-like putative nuclease [Tolypothrix sp. FACHB-123]
MITNEIIESFLRCDYKAYQKFHNEAGCQTEYESLEIEILNLYKNKFSDRIQANSENQIHKVFDLSKMINMKNLIVVIEPVFQSNQFLISFEALEIFPQKISSCELSYTPIIISPNEKISQLEKLSLAIRCLILQHVQGILPEFGKIVYGYHLKSTKVNIATYLEEAKKKLNELLETIKNSKAPRFYQNNFCKTCEFQAPCQAKLVETDDLSLLGRISKKEILKRNNRGIFSIYQLSYTFRPRKEKKKKGVIQNNQQFLWELKALALREKRTYVREVPVFKDIKTEIYLDFEGLPDENFIYLIGMLVREGKQEKWFYFWADSSSDEEEIFKHLFQKIAEFDEYIIYHYGSYEIRALKRINVKLNKISEPLITQIITNSVNILSLFTSNIYPPTYTNELKNIAEFLGFKWTDNKASGLQSIVWRKKWELSNDSVYKSKIIQYNKDDCLSLMMIRNWLGTIKEEIANENCEAFIQWDNIKPEDGYGLKYGKKRYVIPDFEQINQYAYFDYQQNKIYLKTNENIKKAVKRRIKNYKSTNKIDKFVELSPEICPYCNGKQFEKTRRSSSRTIIDLKFMKNGIKKWIVKLESGGFRCHDCKKVFAPRHLNKVSGWGDNLVIWSMNQYVQYRLSFNQIIDILLDSFNIRISLTEMQEFKGKLAAKYQETYNEIINLVMQGTLVHADETQASARDMSSGYVWVFACMDSVFYLLKPNRETDFLHELFKNFQGVIVSDFYSGYDSIKCVQQKCLVHLIRDLNEDLLKNQFNLELKGIVTNFGILLKKIVTTINQYGLKKTFLNPYREDVDEFYLAFIDTEYKTELAVKYKKRFQKYRDKLFTFLNYDNVPWNNNNAESAIKPFAKYRVASSGMATENGIKDYLVLLSIYQTCRYRGISFLDFLKSGEKSIEKYCRTH